MTTTVAVVGASGTMGRLICRVVEELDDFELVARLGSADPLEAMLAAELVVDVTLPGVSPTIVDFAVSHGRKMLVGTSGWSADRIARLQQRLTTGGAAPEAEETPAPDERVPGVIIIPNFSLASTLGTAFAALAARFFDSVEIIESHHLGKIDSPSGTAVRTAERIGAARREQGPVLAPHVDQRARGQQVASVPIHSLRMRGTLARQDVIFGGPGETLTIRHDTISGESYEAGIRLALDAARTATGVTVGLDRLIPVLPSPDAPAGTDGPA